MNILKLFLYSLKICHAQRLVLESKSRCEIHTVILSFHVTVALPLHHRFRYRYMNEPGTISDTVTINVTYVAVMVM